ncbi:hypothetical protein GTY80_04750 [Amycolatopsis sp. SID8362]|nr:hypothetical protein [Amycolatopsis sp. SID8362]NED39271.1 hypothetical protein [Amycolatopsis sp. SID8362]
MRRKYREDVEEQLNILGFLTTIAILWTTVPIQGGPGAPKAACRTGSTS